MGFNKKGGKKFKKRKNVQTKTIMVFKEDCGEEYAKVTRMLGNSNIEAKLPDKTIQFCVIPGSMKKKKWIRVNDILLISIRSYQPKKADVIFVYSPSQVELLKNEGHIPDYFIIDEENQEIECSIVFDNTEEKENIVDDTKQKILDIDDSDDDNDIDLEDI